MLTEMRKTAKSNQTNKENLDVATYACSEYFTSKSTPYGIASKTGGHADRLKNIREQKAKLIQSTQKEKTAAREKFYSSRKSNFSAALAAHESQETSADLS